MKIFLVSAPSETAKHSSWADNLFNTYFLNERSYPLGVAYLGSILKTAGYDVTLFDYFNKPLIEIENEFIALIKKEQPAVVSFTILSMNRTASFYLIKKIKKNAPQTKIISGGVHCSVLYEQILRNFPVDAICLGEGENVIIPLVENVFDKNSLQKVNGIAYLNEKNELVITSPPDITKLDDVPFPEHDAFLTKKSKVLYMITSRGCVGKCIFCSTISYWKRWRTRSPENIVDEIEAVTKRFPNIEYIFFNDDAFTLDNKRAINICKEIIKRGIKIKWTCSARVTPISLEMLEWFKKAGCIRITYGIESGSNRMLQMMKKYITREQIITAFDLTKKAGIEAKAFLLVGLPTEDNESINETISLLKRINYIADGAAIVELYPNTEIYQMAKEKGFINDDYWLTDKIIPKYTYEHSISELTSMEFRIVYESYRNNGILSLAIFAFKKLIAKPTLIIGIGSQLVKNKIYAK